MLCRKNAQAYGVLATLFSKLGDNYIVTKVCVEPYINGRECGFSVRAYSNPEKYDLQIVFSEYRNSDFIVVYTGPYYHFDNGNVPNEDVYFNHQRSFKAYDYAGVADYIIETLELNPNG